MPLDFEALSNWDFEEIEQTLTERDTILYALGLGFGEDPTDKKELAYVYEDGLKAVPSMAVILGYPGFWLRDPKTGVNWQKVLHGEQWLDIYKPLPTHARLVGRSKIDFIADKGEGKGAVIYQSRDIIDADSGEKLARVAMSAFCRGDGGFGGDNRPGPAPAALPDRAPDHVCDIDTLPRQALIYRLSGDYNPLHADPDVARDLADYFAAIAPEGAKYRHDAEGPDDMPAHIRSALTATSLTIPVKDGKLMLGTWQGIYVFEHRRAPHRRRVAVTFTKEA